MNSAPAFRRRHGATLVLWALLSDARIRLLVELDGLVLACLDSQRLLPGVEDTERLEPFENPCWRRAERLALDLPLDTQELLAPTHAEKCGDDGRLILRRHK